MTLSELEATGTAAGADALIHLRAGSVSVVLEVHPLPAVLHWGGTLPDDPAIVEQLARTAQPGVMNSSFDVPRRLSVLPGQHDGWAGTGGLEWHQGRSAGAGLELVEVEADERTAHFGLSAAQGALSVEVTYRLHDSGVLSARASVRNASAEIVDVQAVRLALPVPFRAAEALDFTGRWAGERRPQRRAVQDGTWRRATHRGRPGHDAAYVTAVGTAGFGYGHGEVWAAHLAWSGNQEQFVERLPEGAGSLASVLGAGELLEPGEIRLAPQESYDSPEVLFAFSDRGLDGIQQAFQAYGRTGSAYPASARPLMLNTWEAVYFDHDLEKLLELARTAAAVGVERFVLDDGWFQGRSDDTRGLGDWVADARSWPEGLGALSSEVHALGMEFGLWFEPEMVNVDSDLARAHPEWILGSGAGIDQQPWRHQYVLDLTNSDAFAYLLDRIGEAVARWRVDFIKWDHNRELLNAVSATGGGFSVHRQTEAFYRLVDALRRGHPGLEIESCASGGARVDAGVMRHAQRVWASDTNDPVERYRIHDNTALLLPPEVIGVHVGPAEAHTTHRATDLAFRLSTALFGHAGIEWDITRCAPDELERLTRWTALYRELRPLLHTGMTTHADGLDDGALLTTVSDADRHHALVAWTRLETSASAHSERVRIPGLDPSLRYRVRVRDDLGLPRFFQVTPPEWLPMHAWRQLDGELLARVGVPLPVLNPASTLLLEFQAMLDNVN